MASTNAPFTRSDWNNIVDDINDRRTGCGYSDGLLSLLPENSIWTIANVIAARNSLLDTCNPPPTFSEPVIKWTKAMVEELENAISNCDCGCTESLLDSYRSLDGQNSAWGNYATTGQVSFSGYWNEEFTSYNESFSQSYDFTPIIGHFLANEMVSGISATCYIRAYYYAHNVIEGGWLYDTWDVPVGQIVVACGGYAVSAPSGTYNYSLPQNYSAWDSAGITIADCPFQTAGVSCC